MHEGDAIVSLHSLDPVYVDFSVPEQQLAQVQRAMQVRVMTDATPGRVFTGKVTAVNPEVDPSSRNIKVQATVLNGGGELRPGMFARVQVQLGVREKAIWVPEAAIVPKGQDSFVFRVLAGPDGGGKADLVRVQTGARKVGEVEIVKGIASGDLVVTEGTQKIGPGSSVILSKEEIKK